MRIRLRSDIGAIALFVITLLLGGAQPTRVVRAERSRKEFVAAEVVVKLASSADLPASPLSIP